MTRGGIRKIYKRYYERQQWINTGENPAPSYDGGYGNGNEESVTTLKSLNGSRQWIDVGGNPIVRHAGVAARVRNKTCYPLGNGLRWTDPEVIAV